MDQDGESVPGDAGKTYTWSQAQLDTETYKYSLQTGVQVTNQLDDADLNHWIDNSVTYLTRQDWEGTFPQPVTGLTATEDMIRELDGHLYETPDDAPSIRSFTMGADNGITFVDMKDETYDSPVWDEFLDQLTLDDMVSIIDETWSSPAVDKVNKPESRNQDGPGGGQRPLPPGRPDRHAHRLCGPVPGSRHLEPGHAGQTWQLPG